MRILQTCTHSVGHVTASRFLGMVAATCAQHGHPLDIWMQPLHLFDCRRDCCKDSISANMQMAVAADKLAQQHPLPIGAHLP